MSHNTINVNYILFCVEKLHEKRDLPPALRQVFSLVTVFKMFNISVWIRLILHLYAGCTKIVIINVLLASLSSLNFFISLQTGQKSGLLPPPSLRAHTLSLLHTHLNRITQLSIHTCVVCYLNRQNPNCDQLVCLECGQSDYVKTQAPSPLVFILLFQSLE